MKNKNFRVLASVFFSWSTKFMISIEFLNIIFIQNFLLWCRLLDKLGTDLAR